MKDINNILVNAMEEILGLPASELYENQNLDLFENCLIDSLSIVSLIQHLNDTMNWEIDIKAFQPNQFSTVANFSSAIIKQLDNLNIMDNQEN